MFFCSDGLKMFDIMLTKVNNYILGSLAVIFNNVFLMTFLFPVDMLRYVWKQN